MGYGNATVLNLKKNRSLSNSKGNPKEVIDLALEASGCGVWEMDLTGNRLIWDEQMHLVYECTDKPFSQNPNDWHSKIHPDDTQMVDKKIEEILNGQRVGLFVFRVKSFTRNEWLFIEGNGVLKKDENGNLLGVIGMNRNVTERIKKEKEIENDRLSKISLMSLAAIGELAA